MQGVAIPFDDQSVIRQAKARLERINAEVSGVERLIKEVASQVVGSV